MIFQYTIEQVLDGSKTQTRRVIKNGEQAVRTRYNQIEAVVHNGRDKWRVGSTYAVQPGRGHSQMARICLVKINSEAVSRISTAAARAEGFCNRQEFLQTWRDIHGDSANDRRVWVLTFELVGISVNIEAFQKKTVIKPLAMPHHAAH